MAAAFPFAACAGQAFEICFGYSCSSQASIELPDEDWRTVAGLFGHHLADAAAERLAVRQAIALLESFSGAMTGTDADLGGNVDGSGQAGQMDCIDESTNTTRYLQRLEDERLLQWHTTGPRARRARWIIDVHWTATLVEKDSGQAWAVDSWFLDNGHPPVVQKLDDWLAKRAWR